MKPPHPAALAFKEELVALVSKHLLLHSADSEEGQIAYAAILGMFYAEACNGCRSSGVPIDFAMQLLGRVYGSRVMVSEMRKPEGAAS